MTRVAEEHQSFVVIFASPTIWALHFGLCYVTAAVWCAKQESALVPLGSVRVAIAVYTLLALAAIGVIGWRGFRAHTLGSSPAPHDADTPEDRHRFVGFATVLLSGLSALAVVYAGLVAAFVETCQ
jgi:hypothetical protein